MQRICHELTPALATTAAAAASRREKERAVDARDKWSLDSVCDGM